MPAPKKIHELVARFKQNFEYYQSSEYNEEQLRTEFLNPFFEALGWDMENKSAKGAERDVHYEKLVHGKAPDFGFYLDKKIRFFVEAKKPSLNICDNPDAALQLRGYGWSAKTARGILTDFEEFSYYDTAVRPKVGETSRVARIECVKFEQYIDKWDEIAALFSREAVLGGSLEKLAKKRAQEAVDDELLEDISRWREALAKNIANRNEVSEERLNRIVQDTIARILFLRICEDRQIAHEGALAEIARGEGTFQKLFKLFKKAEKRYDSDLFEVESIANLIVDDKVLKDIISELYFPKCPFKFDAIPAEILGHVYEQFLGKVIRLTEGGHAKVEDKPEVRKAGGIYYTPTYIVEYIVRNTVGKLVEGKTPKKIEKLSIVDPACGSGSFLLGAYKFLADWYRDWYVADGVTKHEKDKKIYQDAAGLWQLTLDERKRILTTHIYGVDLDRQAVEMTKLSLMLEALRAPEQTSLFNERMLPRLGENIKCGNALIASDYSAKPDDLIHVHAFDWPVQFPAVFNAGGFDVVIGNPPYGVSFDSQEKKYISDKFVSYQYKYDSYIYFIEKAIGLVKKAGFVSYITPEIWLKLETTEALRRLIHDKSELVSLRICGENVFKEAVVNTIVFVLRRGLKNNEIKIELIDRIWSLPASMWTSASGFTIDYRLIPEARKVMRHFKQSTILPLSSFGDAIQGITPYDKYRGQSAEIIKKRGYHFAHKKDETCGKWLSGQDIDRYVLSWSGEWLSYGPWLGAPREPRFFTGSRLLFREIPGNERRIQATFIENETYYHGHSITPFKANEGKNVVSILYLLGLSNSRLLSWYGGLILPNFGKSIFPKLNPQDIKALPICQIDFSNAEDVRRHDELVRLVGTMLGLMSKLYMTTSESEKITLQNAVNSNDLKIDQLVYKLYGLTAEDIAIVEKGHNKI